jgi:hypothetical protein
MRPFTTFLRLPRVEQAAFLRAWLTVMRAKSILARRGLRASLKGLPAVAPPGGDVAWPRAARWVPVAARYSPGGARCLVRSLALMKLLRQDGLACELRIGVAATEPSLDAHAWVEIDGVAVTDSDRRYRVFGSRK